MRKGLLKEAKAKEIEIQSNRLQSLAPIYYLLGFKSSYSHKFSNKIYLPYRQTQERNRASLVSFVRANWLALSFSSSWLNLKLHAIAFMTSGMLTKFVLNFNAAHKHYSSNLQKSSGVQTRVSMSSARWLSRVRYISVWAQVQRK